MRIFVLALCLCLVSVWGADGPGAKETGEGKPTKTAEIKPQKPTKVVAEPTETVGIEPEEPAQVVEKKGSEPNDKIERQETVEITEEKNLDFTPSHVFVFFVPPGTNECLYETIEIDEPTDVSGAFFVSRGGHMDIKMTVHDELKNRLFISDSGSGGAAVTEGKFSLQITNSGTYKFCFDNTFSYKVAKQVVFAVDIEPGVSFEEMLTKDHLEPTKDTIRRLTRQSRLLKQGVKFMGMRLETQAKVQAATNNHVVWFTVLESLVVLVVTFGQVYYIQDLINNRRARV